MKKMLRLTQTLFMASLLASCGGGNPSGTEEEFKPSLDTTTECSIRVDGDYGNFEALEAEFDRFKEYYPKVHLSYLKIDGSVADVLNGEEAPNIFFCHPKMIGNEQYASVVSHMEDLSDPALKMNLDCIRPNLLKRDSEGKVFMVPVFSRTYGTLINKDLFNKEGIRFAVVMCHQEVPSLFTRFFNIWPIRKGSVNILVWLLLFFQLLVFAKQNEVLSCSLCRHIRLKLLRIDAECHVRKGHKLTSKSLLPQQFCRMVVASTNSKMMVLVHLINILGKDVVRLIVHGLW